MMVLNSIFGSEKLVSDHSVDMCLCYSVIVLCVVLDPVAILLIILVHFLSLLLILKGDSGHGCGCFCGRCACERKTMDFWGSGRVKWFLCVCVCSW